MTFLLVVAAVGSAAVAGIVLGGAELGLGRDIRFLASFALSGLTVLIGLFFGGFPRIIRKGFLVGLAAAAVAGVASIRRVELNGAMMPVRFEYRWSTTHDDALDRFRAGAKSQPTASDSWKADPDDSLAEYRGPNRDGASPGPALAKDWASQKPRLVWGPQPVGAGYSGFAAAGRHLVTLEQRRDNEAVVCYDRDTGKEQWSVDYLARFDEPQGGPGPRSTPTIVDGMVYSLGAKGDLYCIDGASGKARWNVNILQDVGAGNLMWAMSGSPLVVDDLVVVNPGVTSDGKTGGLVAYDRKSGKRAWTGSEGHRAGYSSPQLTTVCGKRQILIFDGDGIAGVEVADGRQIWRQSWSTNQGINVAQPLVAAPNQILVSSGYLVGAGLFQLTRTTDDKWTIERLWKSNRTLACKFNSPVFRDGFVYGLNDVTLVCIDPKTGKSKWRGGAFGYGQVLIRGDVLIVMAEDGRVAAVEATPEKYREIGVIQAFESPKNWNPPALAGKYLYVRNHLEMACYEMPVEQTASPQ